jgi:hypothetical protein
MAHSMIGRVERGEVRHLSMHRVTTLALAVGLVVHVGLYPLASALRDAAHAALLQRFCRVLSSLLAIRFEVPIPIPGDLRHADAVVDATPSGVMVEAETRLDDSQALIRRIRGKQRDLGCDRVVLVLADTKHNRATVASVPAFGAEFPVSSRRCLSALRAGTDPGGDALLFL